MGNPEDRFSCDMAQIMLFYQFKPKIYRFAAKKLVAQMVVYDQNDVKVAARNLHPHHIPNRVTPEIPV